MDLFYFNYLVDLQIFQFQNLNLVYFQSKNSDIHAFSNTNHLESINELVVPVIIFFIFFFYFSFKTGTCKGIC